MKTATRTELTNFSLELFERRVYQEDPVEDFTITPDDAHNLLMLSRSIARNKIPKVFLDIANQIVATQEEINAQFRIMRESE